MMVWHVTTPKKWNRMLLMGAILPPVRAWNNERAARRFAKQTKRSVILTLCFPDDTPALEGHGGEAVVFSGVYRL